MNASRMRRPSALRIGMFCRLGSLLDSRPVTATACAKVVCTRPRARVHHARQLVGVSGLELRHSAVVQNQARERIVQRQLLEHLLVGRGLPARRLLQHRQLVLLEQHFLDLLRGVEVEGLPGERPWRAARCRACAVRAPGSAVQQRGVDQHAGALHVEQHLHDRHLDVLVHEGELRVGADERMQLVMELQAVTSASSAEYSVACSTLTCSNAICPAPLPATSVVAQGLEAADGAAPGCPCRAACGSRARRIAAGCRGAPHAGAMPWFASTCMSYFTFWPTLARAGSSSQAFRRASVASNASCSGAPA